MPVKIWAIDLCSMACPPARVTYLRTGSFEAALHELKSVTGWDYVSLYEGELQAVLGLIDIRPLNENNLSEIKNFKEESIEKEYCIESINEHGFRHAYWYDSPIENIIALHEKYKHQGSIIIKITRGWSL